MKIGLLGMLLAGALCIPSMGAACDFSRSALIDLTEDGERERLVAEVRGPDCDTARFLVKIKDADGVELYGFSHPFSDMYVPHPFVDPELKSKQLVNTVIDDGVKTEMPPVDEVFTPEEAPGLVELRFVSRARYIAMQDSGLAYLAHPSWYEGFIYVIFDKEKREFCGLWWVLVRCPALHRRSTQVIVSLNAQGWGIWPGHVQQAMGHQSCE